MTLVPHQGHGARTQRVRAPPHPVSKIAAPWKLCLMLSSSVPRSNDWASAACLRKRPRHDKKLGASWRYLSAGVTHSRILPRGILPRGRWGLTAKFRTVPAPQLQFLGLRAPFPTDYLVSVVTRSHNAESDIGHSANSTCNCCRGSKA